MSLVSLPCVHSVCQKQMYVMYVIGQSAMCPSPCRSLADFLRTPAGSPPRRWRGTLPWGSHAPLFPQTLFQDTLFFNTSLMPKIMVNSHQFGNQYKGKLDDSVRCCSETWLDPSGCLGSAWRDARATACDHFVLCLEYTEPTKLLMQKDGR